jgi:hypothetical protein
MAVRLVLHSTEHALVAQWREQRFPKPRVRAVAPHWPRGGQSSDQDVTSTVGLDLDSVSCREVMPGHLLSAHRPASIR